LYLRDFDAGGTFMKITERRTATRSGLQVTALGLGTASFGGLYQPTSAAEALGALAKAWEMGIRYFDTAPMYGLGRAEHLVGQFLREDVPRSLRPAISTKVGRLMARPRPGRDLPPEAPKNPLDPGWHNGLNFQEVFDYSYDGIMRSFDDSQQRLGLPEIDLLYVHDIGRLTHADRHDHHWNALVKGGFKALAELRAAGLIKGFGLGVNEAEAIEAAMGETDPDCCLLAGRYTLLDRSAEPLLARARAHGVAIVAGGVFNSGILAAGDSGQRKFNYMDAPADILEKVDRLAEVCRRYDVPLGAAAVQFPIRNPAIVSVLVGARSPEQIVANVAWFEQEMPAGLWDALDAEA
jgi:D-threo-aldose 1-dehydrogenase